MVFACTLLFRVWDTANIMQYVCTCVDGMFEPFVQIVLICILKVLGARLTSLLAAADTSAAGFGADRRQLKMKC